MNTAPPPLLKQQELREYYGVSDWTINKWVREGCPVERLRGGTRRFDLEAVKTWHAAGAAEGRAGRAAKASHALSFRAA